MEKMNLYLDRFFKGSKYTIGRLYINGVYFCDTLEDVVRELQTKEDKVYGETAIPAGTYKVEITYSPTFKMKLPLLLDVPYFTGIRIHAGNTPKDTKGCILVGENKAKGKVLNSRKTLIKLLDIIRDKELEITIV